MRNACTGCIPWLQSPRPWISGKEGFGAVKLKGTWEEAQLKKKPGKCTGVGLANRDGPTAPRTSNVIGPMAALTRDPRKWGFKESGNNGNIRFVYWYFIITALIPLQGNSAAQDFPDILKQPLRTLYAADSPQSTQDGDAFDRRASLLVSRLERPLK
ncbi:hypothetical protein AWENTII_005302 [Aspergillus wentii]